MASSPVMPIIITVVYFRKFVASGSLIAVAEFSMIDDECPSFCNSVYMRDVIQGCVAFRSRACVGVRVPVRVNVV